MLAATDLANVAAVIARLALGVVFVLAAGTKLRDPQGSRQGMSDLLSPRFAPLSIALPIVELAIALGMLVAPPPWRNYATFASMLLLVAFTGAILRAMQRPHPPACHCFGASSTQPVGAPMVVRNAAFLLLALVALAG